ncbi:MAG: hypothetical protein QHI48_08175 [Bacteroidota bacterium]|nr:hypothetical protein [Bacteroidota bacterium]
MSVTEMRHPLGSSLSTSYSYTFATESVEMAGVSMDSTEYGKSEVMGSVTYTAGGGATRVEGTLPTPDFRVGDPYPQPAAEQVRIPLATARGGRVTLSVVDMLGREVSSLPELSVPAGSNELVWLNPGLAPGRYLCIVRAGNAVSARPLLIVR